MSWMEGEFPGLVGSDYRVTSPEDTRYNCIAWAAGEDARWWWPDPFEACAWPEEAPRVVSIDAFTLAYATLGYAMASSDALDDQVEKIAIFARSDGHPTHVARQLPSGMWTSKLGRSEDISHVLRALEGAEYGHVVRILARHRR